MKHLVPSLFLLLTFSVFSQEQLNNQSILDLLEVGFEKNVIIAKINNSPGLYDTSIDALKDLQQRGIPSEILAAMINNTVPEESSSGIFYNVEGEVYKKLEPTNFAGTKTSYVNSAFTYGLGSNAIRSYIHHHTSDYKVPGELQLFKFQFVNTEAEKLGENNWWFNKATHPKDFVLVKLVSSEKKNSREMKTGKIGGIEGHQTGVDSKDAIPFIIQEGEDNTYLVRTQRPLTPGEYAFFFQGFMPLNSGFNNHSVFAFTIVK